MARIIDFERYRSSKEIKTVDTDSYDNGCSCDLPVEAYEYDDYYFENDDDDPMWLPEL